MDDASYDALEDELRLLAPSDPVLALVGSPVPAGTMLTKAPHSIPMGSQNKVNSKVEFKSWCIKNSVKAIHASLKGDGGSVAAYFRDGRLIQAITRGDGAVGEDITVNAMRFKGLPAFIGTTDGGFTGAVRFEAILTIEDWGKIDPSKSKNPRNVGNGILGRKNGHQCDLLTVFAFDIDETRNGVPVQWATETEKTDRLTELGINVIEHKCFETADEVVKYFDQVAQGRAELDFWIDGVVLKVNDIAIQRELGVASGCPRGQVAWKFDSAGAESVVESVVVSGGHTGGLYPTAQFRPVEIGGTTVCSASLSNFDEIDRLGLAVGDSVWVVKANDIIPKITRVTNRPCARELIIRPTSCPFCGGAVGHKKKSDGDDGVDIVCKNDDCEKKSTGKIGRWVSSLDILGIGDSVLEAMVEGLDLEDAADLYAIGARPNELANLHINAERGIRLGEKRANSILRAIEAKRTLSLSQFLGSLGVNHLGKRRVELIVRAAAGELDTLVDWRNSKLRNSAFAATAGVPGIGEQIQDGIEAMAVVIDKMLANGVVVLAAQAPCEDGDAPVMKTVCISGKLPSGKKKSDYESPLFACGFKLLDDVAKGLTYLVLADPRIASTKSQKATRLGVEVISEAQLEALIAA